MFDKIDLKFTDFKNIINKKKIRIQYIEDDFNYILFAYDGPIKYQCELPKPDKAFGLSDSEVAEFNGYINEFNSTLKESANRPIGISPVELDYYVDGKTISVGETDQSSYVDFSYSNEVEVSGLFLRPYQAQLGDFITMEKWVFPNVMGPGAVKVGEFGKVSLLGGDGVSSIHFSPTGTGHLPTYAFMRVIFTKGTAPGARTCFCDLEVLR